MKSRALFLLGLGMLFLNSCTKWDDNERSVPECEYNGQETVSFIDFGLTVPAYTGTYFDNVFGMNYASSDRTIYFLTEALETKGNYLTDDTAANATVRFLTDGKDCAGNGTFSYSQDELQVGSSNMVTPAPSVAWTGDVKISISTDAFMGEYDTDAFTIYWSHTENNPDGIVEGNLTGQKLPYRASTQSVLIKDPLYGGGSGDGEFLN